MARKRGSNPKTKIEFISKAGATTDISSYFLAGANIEKVKERAPDEIQAGQFDIVLSNHDDKFSEYKSASLLFGTEYHGAAIRVSQGFVLPDGTEEYLVQAVGFIDQLITDANVSRVVLRCRDRLWRIMDQQLHLRPITEVPAPGVGNVGTGTFSIISTKPFATLDEDWTITCTTAGADGVGVFSVVGSVSGSIGPATSGTEFLHAAAGIKFTVAGGGTDWAVDDVFTFSTRKGPQWAGVNLAKIIWSILTGYNWDADTEEDWSDFVFDFDHTQSSANVDIDYDSFVTAVAAVAALGVFDLTGYAPYEAGAIEFLQELTTLVLGSIYTGSDGRIIFKVYVPNPVAIVNTFSDEEKIFQLGYNRTIDEVINYVVVNYVRRLSWPFSDGANELDGIHVEKDDTSISEFKTLGISFSINWFESSGQHVQDFSNKLVSRYNEPPLNISFDTGMDALESEIGDIVGFSDQKYGFEATAGEIAMIRKQFDIKPTKISMLIRRDAQIDQIFGLIGSEADEGDGESPQTDTYDSASSAEKAKYSYFGDTGSPPPDYRIF
jgi:hypothetical protein